MLPGTQCYAEIQRAFAGEDIYTEDGSLDAKKLSAVIFSDPARRARLNGIVHPAVKREILRLAELEKKAKSCEYLILEAALLIEEGYGAVCDELWYVYADSGVRRQRLKEQRGYSDEKTDAILSSQLSDAEFRRHCRVVIDNNGTRREAFLQIREALGNDL